MALTNALYDQPFLMPTLELSCPVLRSQTSKLKRPQSPLLAVGKIKNRVTVQLEQSQTHRQISHSILWVWSNQEDLLDRVKSMFLKQDHVLSQFRGDSCCFSRNRAYVKLLQTTGILSVYALDERGIVTKAASYSSHIGSTINVDTCHFLSPSICCFLFLTNILCIFQQGWKRSQYSDPSHFICPWFSGQVSWWLNS